MFLLNIKNMNVLERFILSISLKFISLIFFINLINIETFAKNLYKKYHTHAEDKKVKIDLNEKENFYASINWIKIEAEEIISEEKINWKKSDETKYIKKIKENKSDHQYIRSVSSLNRSIIFNDYIVGPDISWLVPPGLAWNGIYSFDGSIRGYSRRKKGQGFLGFNGGDAVGQFYYQFLKKEKYNLGINLGVRSVNNKENEGIKGSRIGEGLSSGFRFDYAISNSSGFAFGAEQLLHFDGLTDTGRDIYATVSKAWWKDKFPINVATAGFGTGKLGEGSIKGLCSDLLGGSGTEIKHQRSLCWAPIFSLARVHNDKHSTFFEYNSYYFLLGQSYAPFKEVPIRATFAVVLSDHIHNYKLKNFDDLSWVFRLSAGF